MFYLSAGKILSLTQRLTNLPLITGGIPSGRALICCSKLFAGLARQMGGLQLLPAWGWLGACGLQRQGNHQGTREGARGHVGVSAALPQRCQARQGAKCRMWLTWHRPPLPPRGMGTIPMGQGPSPCPAMGDESTRGGPRTGCTVMMGILGPHHQVPQARGYCAHRHLQQCRKQEQCNGTGLFPSPFCISSLPSARPTPPGEQLSAVPLPPAPHTSCSVPPHERAPGLTTNAWAPASPSCWDGSSLQTCTVLGKAESRDTKITAPGHGVPGSVL